MSPVKFLLATSTALLLVACGGSDRAEKPASTPAAEPGLGAIKGYLLDHTADLAGSTVELERRGKAYAALVESVGSDYDRLLAEKRRETRAAVEGLQATWRRANPEYEEMEGVVAGVPELAEYDVIIDAGSDASDPESAVPFDVEVPGGETLKQPGNFFFLTETTLFGTGKAFQAKHVEPDLDGDGKVAFGEALPDARYVLAFTRDFAAQATKLDAAGKAWAPERADAFQALVTMTPTMSEYFGQWKASRFIQGASGDASFAASSRLQDIEDILSGLVLVYDNIQPTVAEADAAQAEQTARELKRLRDFAVDLRKREAAGTRFDAEQADTLGAQAQSRAEAIAGQVSQAAGQLGIELES